MTRGESELINDLNEFVRQVSDQLDEEQSSGIRPHPRIETTEQTLDTTRFGFQFGPEPTAEVEPAIPVPPATEPPTGACCNGTVCTVTTEANCVAGGGHYHGDGTDCTPNPCANCDCLTALGYTEIRLELQIDVTFLSGTLPDCSGVGTMKAGRTVNISDHTGTCTFALGGTYAFQPGDFDTSGMDCVCGFDGFQTNWQLTVDIDCEANTMDWSSDNAINFICIGGCGNGCAPPSSGETGLPIADYTNLYYSCEYDCSTGHFQADYTVRVTFL